MVVITGNSAVPAQKQSRRRRFLKGGLMFIKIQILFIHTKEEADANAAEPRIDCIHIYKEYEVEE
jgi:hypothetical protein